MNIVVNGRACKVDVKIDVNSATVEEADASASVDGRYTVVTTIVIGATLSVPGPTDSVRTEVTRENVFMVMGSEARDAAVDSMLVALVIVVEPNGKLIEGGCHVVCI